MGFEGIIHKRLDLEEQSITRERGPGSYSDKLLGVPFSFVTKSLPSIWSTTSSSGNESTDLIFQVTTSKMDRIHEQQISSSNTSTEDVEKSGHVHHVEEGKVMNIEQGEHNVLAKKLKSRHMQMIAIGTSCVSYPFMGTLLKDIPQEDQSAQACLLAREALFEPEVLPVSSLGS